MQVTTTIPLFAAKLEPARSYGTFGGWLGLALAGLVAMPLLIAMPDFVWPALFAFGLAAGGLIGFSIRQARRRRQYQQVNLWRDQLEVVTVSTGTNRQMQRFDPTRIRLRLQRDSFERTVGIFLRHEQGELELGSFLSREEKASFARAFGTALRQARRAD